MNIQNIVKLSSILGGCCFLFFLIKLLEISCSKSKTQARALSFSLHFYQLDHGLADNPSSALNTLILT